MEEWKDVKGYEGLYRVSNEGRVFSLMTNQVLKTWLKSEKEPYRKVNLYWDGKKTNFLVHRLVAIAFLEKVFGKNEINHKDGDPRNCNVNNLEWSTRSENEIHSYHVLGRIPNGSKKVGQYDLDGNILATYRSGKLAAKVVGTHFAGIHRCCRGEQKTAWGYKRSYID